MHVKSVSVVKHVRYNVPPPIQCNVNWNNEWEVGLYNEVVDAVEVGKSREKNFQESPTFLARIVDRCDQLSFLIGTPNSRRTPQIGVQEDNDMRRVVLGYLT